MPHRLKNPLQTEKARIRQEVLRTRDLLDTKTRQVKSSLVTERLLLLPAFLQAKSIFFFVSFRSEVSTISLIKEALRMGKRVALPRVERKHRALDLYEITDMSEIAPGCMGIPEPPAAEERKRGINDMDLVIMPGAAFDASGNRLGYGGSYYDRLLAGLDKKIPLVAIAYDEQIQDSIPAESHDIRVNIIVTDKRVVHCKKQ